MHMFARWDNCTGLETRAHLRKETISEQLCSRPQRKAVNEKAEKKPVNIEVPAGTLVNEVTCGAWATAERAEPRLGCATMELGLR